LDISINVARTADLNHMLTGIAAVVRDNRRVLSEPSPLVGVSGFSEGGITISARPWVGIGDVGAASGEIRKAIVETFRLQDVIAPAPQRNIMVIGAGEPTPLPRRETALV
jgi:small conductance mechanosensitive channel